MKGNYGFIWGLRKKKLLLLLLDKNKMKDVISGPQVMQIEYCHAKIKTMQFCRQVW